MSSEEIREALLRETYRLPLLRESMRRRERGSCYSIIVHNTWLNHHQMTFDGERTTQLQAQE